MRTVFQSTYAWSFYGLFVLAFSATTWAQEDVSAEKQLQNVIERLEQRVTELEAEVSALKAEQQAPSNAAADPAAISERVDEIARRLEEQEEEQVEAFRAYWKDALRFETRDGRFRFRVGGRLQLDAGWVTADRNLELGYGDLEDQVEFRRARIFLGGTVYDDYFFEAEYDFAGGDPEFKDVFIGMQNIPYAGTLILGHRKEPFSMETITSDNFTAFMERSLIDSFSPDRNTGITLTNTAFNERATWAAGIYHQTDDFGNGGSDGGYSVTARVTGLPIYRDEGHALLHLGASYSHRNIDDFIRYRTRPEMHLVDSRYVDTGEFYADDVDLYGAEAAVQYGAFSMQSEYIRSDVETRYANDPTFDGWYVYAAVLLTGETHPYDLEEGVFGRVRPKRNFAWGKGEANGWGAWELGLRYSTIDLGDGPFLRGGQEENWTLGLNWYLNPNMRVMWNYVRADIDSYRYDGIAEGFTTRVQVAF